MFDIGVGEGTPWLYEAFSGTRLVLVEALERFRPRIEGLAAELDADFVMTALGAAPGRAPMRIPKLSATGASLLPRHPDFTRLEVAAERSIEDESCDVDVMTLDSIVARWTPPYVLKLDVEGAELDVLRGAGKALESTELVLMEMSVLPRFAGEASFAERIGFMDRAGFRLFDIPVLSQTSRRGPLSFIDAAFVRKENALQLSLW